MHSVECEDCFCTLLVARGLKGSIGVEISTVIGVV